MSYDISLLSDLFHPVCQSLGPSMFQLNFLTFAVIVKIPYQGPGLDTHTHLVMCGHSLGTFYWVFFSGSACSHWTTHRQTSSNVTVPSIQKLLNNQKLFNILGFWHISFNIASMCTMSGNSKSQFKKMGEIVRSK